MVTDSQVRLLRRRVMQRKPLAAAAGMSREAHGAGGRVPYRRRRRSREAGLRARTRSVGSGRESSGCLRIRTPVHALNFNAGHLTSGTKRHRGLGRRGALAGQALGATRLRSVMDRPQRRLILIQPGPRPQRTRSHTRPRLRHGEIPRLGYGCKRRGLLLGRAEPPLAVSSRPWQHLGISFWKGRTSPRAG